MEHRRLGDQAVHVARAAAPAWGVVAMDGRMLVGGAYKVRGSGSPSQPHDSRVARAAAPAWCCFALPLRNEVM